jgi:hypothetical protein
MERFVISAWTGRVGAECVTGVIIESQRVCDDRDIVERP